MHVQVHWEELLIARPLAKIHVHTNCQWFVSSASSKHVSERNQFLVSVLVLFFCQEYRHYTRTLHVRQSHHMHSWARGNLHCSDQRYYRTSAQTFTIISPPLGNLLTIARCIWRFFKSVTSRALHACSMIVGERRYHFPTVSDWSPNDDLPDSLSVLLSVDCRE